MRHTKFFVSVIFSAVVLSTSVFSQDTTVTVTSDGKMGIGTTSPTEKLVVGDDLGSGLSGNRITVGNNSGASAINLGEDMENRGFIFWDPSTNHMAIGTRNAGVHYGYTMILRDGKIGSGTFEPTEKLDIRGNIAVTGTVDSVDISELKARLDKLPNYQHFDATSLTVPVGSNWVKMFGPNNTFTKKYEDSKIEVFFNGQLEVSNMNSVASTITEIRIDDKATTHLGNKGIYRPENVAGGAPDWQNISIMAVFENVNAGNHTISLYAKNYPNGASSNVRIDPLNLGGFDIIVKETW